MLGPLAEIGDRHFDRLSPYPGSGLRNHCLRLYRLARLALARANTDLRADLVYLLAMVHDLGLVCPEASGRNYLERGRDIFRSAVSGTDLGERALQIGDECLLFNHRLLEPPGLCADARCFRQAVWIEHTRGLRHFGLDRAAVREVFKAHPRDNFDKVLVDFARRVLRDEPRTLIDGIFF